MYEYARLFITVWRSQQRLFEIENTFVYNLNCGCQPIVVVVVFLTVVVVVFLSVVIVVVVMELMRVACLVFGDLRMRSSYALTLFRHWLYGCS